MTYQWILANIIALLIGSLACAQQSPYPTTQYQSFDSSPPFATSSPFEPDQIDQQNRSMSPDSWGSVNQRQQNHFQAPQLDRSEDSPVDSASKSLPANSDQSTVSPPFQSASFGSRTQESVLEAKPQATQGSESKSNVTTTPAARYPLADKSQQSDSAVPKRSIIRSPFDEIPDPPEYDFVAPQAKPAPGIAGAGPDFRPDLGHRSIDSTDRIAKLVDTGEKFDFEKKKREYPPMSEILATGRYFGSGTLHYMRPSFQANTAIATSVSGISTPFDFDFEAGHHFQAGFESKYGPGLELGWMQYDEASNPARFTSNGIDAGTTSVSISGQNQPSFLTAANAGESLEAIHSIDIESIEVNFFKSVKLPISRINGKFGFQILSIEQQLNATLTDSSNNVIGTLRNQSDLHAYGPHFVFEYFRPIGHTKLEIYSRAGGSVLFGRQDQFVQNSLTGSQSRVGADEFLTILDYMSGLQYRHLIGENRYLFARAGFTFQSWLNGGTAISPQDDFGLRGFSVTLGYNR